MKAKPDPIPLPVSLGACYGPRAGREAAGLTRRDLSKRTGYSVDYIAQLETRYDRLARMTSGQRQQYLRAHPTTLPGYSTAQTLWRGCKKVPIEFYAFPDQESTDR